MGKLFLKVAKSLFSFKISIYKFIDH